MNSYRGLVWLSVLCGLGVLWAAGLIVTLALGVRLMSPQLAVGVAAILTVPGFAAGILANRQAYRTTPPRRFWSLATWVPPHVSLWAAGAAALAFGGFWLSIVLAFLALDGSPEIRDGRYVLNDHDRITVVDRATYDRQLDHEQQISLGVLGAFAVGGTFLCAARAADHDDRASAATHNTVTVKR